MIWNDSISLEKKRALAKVILEAASDLEKVNAENFWNQITADKLKFLQDRIKPLFRTISQADFKAMLFEKDVLEISLVQLKGEKEKFDTLKESIKEKIGELLLSINLVAKEKALIQEEDFGKKSVCRNSLIASLLLRSDYIEKMGTGINRIKEALKEANCPAPIFEFDTFFTMTFPRVAQERTKEKVSEKTSDKIIKLLKTNENYTILDLSKKVGVTTRSIERNLNNLQKSGKIKRIGPNKGGHWEIT